LSTHNAQHGLGQSRRRLFSNPTTGGHKGKRAPLLGERAGDSQLVTQSTRHKEAVNSSQANKQANIKAVLPQQYNYPYPPRRRYEKMHKKLSRKTKWTTKHTHTLTQNFT